MFFKVCRQVFDATLQVQVVYPFEQVGELFFCLPATFLQSLSTCFADLHKKSLPTCFADLTLPTWLCRLDFADLHMVSRMILHSKSANFCKVSRQTFWCLSATFWKFADLHCRLAQKHCRLALPTCIADLLKNIAESEFADLLETVYDLHRIHVCNKHLNVCRQTFWKVCRLAKTFADKHLQRL